MFIQAYHRVTVLLLGLFLLAIVPVMFLGYMAITGLVGEVKLLQDDSGMAAARDMKENIRFVLHSAEAAAEVAAAADQVKAALAATDTRTKEATRTFIGKLLAAHPLYAGAAVFDRHGRKAAGTLPSTDLNWLETPYVQKALSGESAMSLTSVKLPGLPPVLIVAAPVTGTDQETITGVFIIALNLQALSSYSTESIHATLSGHGSIIDAKGHVLLDEMAPERIGVLLTPEELARIEEAHANNAPPEIQRALYTTTMEETGWEVIIDMHESSENVYEYSFILRISLIGLTFFITCLYAAALYYLIRGAVRAAKKADALARRKKRYSRRNEH